MNEEYKEGELVWHTNFKMVVKYCHVSQPVSKKLKNIWHIVQLPNGGFHETRLIEKYKKQDR